MRARLSQFVLGCLTSVVLFTSALAKNGTLTGTVVGANGNPKSFARVRLQGPTQYAAVCDVNGHFTIANFGTGTYLVNIRQNDNVENQTVNIGNLTVTLTVKW